MSLSHLTNSELTPPEVELPGHLEFRALQGSHLHGTNTPTSDEDWRGVFMLHTDAFLGLDRADLTVERKPATGSDQVYWELGQFCRLLLKGNPNILEMLWTPRELTTDLTPVISPLFDKRVKFVTRTAASAYMGWLGREAKEVAALHKGHAKRLSHVIRLTYTLESMLTRHPELLEVVLEPDHKAVVLGVKTGVTPYEEGERIAGERLILLEELYAEKRDSMPQDPREWTQRYLVETRHAYGSRRW